MKIKMMTIAAVFCCAMSSMMFTACGSDDDDNKTLGDDGTPVAAGMQYSFYVSDDMLAILDMTVEYYDGDGKLTTEKLTQKEWKISVASQKIPVSLGACVKAKIKDGADVNTINKVSEYGYNNAAYSTTATGRLINNSGERSRYFFDAKDLSSLLNQKDGIIMSSYYNINDEGKVEDQSWK